MRDPIQPENAVHNPQTVQAPSKQISLDTPGQTVARAGSPARLALNTRNYWKKRLYRESYQRDGRQNFVPEFYVKLNHAARRRAFNLGTANKEAAAEKAKEIWLHLQKHDWQATLDKYAPTGAAADHAPTVGEFLAEVNRTAGLNPRTLHRYSQYLRMIVAHIAGIADKAGARYDYVGGGRVQWLAKVDATRLDDLTPVAAADWKTDYLDRADGDPMNRIRVARSFNAALRSAKSLFAPRVIHADNFGLRVPKFRVKDPQQGEREIFWFENLTFESCGSMKFAPPDGVTYETLILAGRRELRKAAPDAYLLLLLCLGAGLRRIEADVFQWNQVHYGATAADCFLNVEANQFIQPKHGSSGLVYVEPELAKEILSFKARATSAFVVNAPMDWKRASTWHRYRCEPHWQRLNGWLAGKGITDRKRIHTLRKLFGDAITKAQGIFAAAAQLRHSSVQMTERHYTDPRQRAPLPVASLLSDSPVKSLGDAEVDEIIRRLDALPPKKLARIAAHLKQLRSRSRRATRRAA
jgi:integrase